VKPAASGGNDALACTSVATACATLNGAFQKAQSGDRIEVMNGSYDVQTVYPNASVSSLVTFYPESQSGVAFTNAVQIRASHVEMDDFQFGYVTPAAAPATQTYTQGLQIQVPTASGSTSHGTACVSDVVIKNANGKSFAINNGVSNVRIVGGTWGNQGWGLGSTPDGASSFSASSIGASSSYHCPDASTVAAPATDVTIDDVHFGNNFQACENATLFGTNPQAACVDPTHPDCLHVTAPTVRLTIENSWFDHCMGFFLNLNVENAFSLNGNSTLKDALFQNNLFGDDNSGGYDSWNQITQAGTGPLYVTCDNVVFRNNTWGHNQAPNPLFAIDCPTASGASAGVQFYNNIFETWSGSCPTGVALDYNLFVQGSTCGTHATTGDPAFVQSHDSPDGTQSWAAAPWTSNFHLGSGSAAIGAGKCEPTKAAATDFDGKSRPQDGSTCDVGAFAH
jgi:hypothetical protein